MGFSEYKRDADSSLPASLKEAFGGVYLAGKPIRRRLIKPRRTPPFSTPQQRVRII